MADDDLRIVPGTTRELRLAVVLYGGVSLAIYMHGVTKEIHRLVRASTPDAAPVTPTEKAWRSVLDRLATRDRVRTRAVVDIVAGTSAGGINGVFLAKAVAHDLTQDGLRELWIEKGDIGLLVAGPGRLPWKLRLGVHWFPRARKAAPLDGEHMVEWIYDALADMEPAGGAAGPQSLLPEGHTLELFVTMTDLSGYQREVTIEAPKWIWDLQHRHVMTFRHRWVADAAGREHHDLDAAGNLALTFAARATSSFPGAFPPVTPGGVARILAGQTGGAKVPPRFFRQHQLAGVTAETTWFVDGGVLDNRPFSLAIDAIRSRPAETEVDRRLLYLDPDPPAPPGRPDPQAPASPEPEELAVVLRSVTTPQKEPILNDLLSVAALNENVERLKEIVDDTVTGDFAPVTAVVGQVIDTDPAAEGQEGGRLREWQQQVRTLAVEPVAGLGQGSYVRLKIADAVDVYARIANRVCDYPRDSVHGQLVHEGVRAWARRRRLFEHATDATEAQIAFLKRFDLAYGERLLRFILAGINAWYGPIADGEAGYPSREQADRLKAVAWGHLQHLIADRSGASIQADPRSAAAVTACFPEDALQRFIDDHGFDPEAFAEHKAADLDTLEATLAAVLDERLDGFSGRVFAEVDRETAGWDLPDRRRELLTRYLGFPLWDAILYPIQSMADAGEGDAVQVVRMSPRDEDILTAPPGARKLGGAGMHHFGAFFDKGARERDYLWGRIDGASRLVHILVGDDDALRRELTATVVDAILAEDADTLPLASELIAHLRGQLPALRTG